MKRIFLLLAIFVMSWGTAGAQSDDAPFRIDSEGRAKLLKHRARVILEGRAKDRYSLSGDPQSQTLRKNVFSDNNCGVDIGNTYGDLGSGKIFGPTRPLTVIIDGDIINAYNRCTR